MDVDESIWGTPRDPSRSSPQPSAAIQGETKVLKLKNLRPQDYASYTCQVSVRNVCGIPDKAITFQLTNTTGTGTSPVTPTQTLSPL